MKDILIRKKHIKQELTWLAVCLLVTEAINIYAIIHYDGQWNEAFWSLGYVCISAIILYAILVLLRLLFAGLTRIFRKKTY